jgi:NO-binding membrane sensor protein with MHYT domain
MQRSLFNFATMLTEKQEAFLVYWGKYRLRNKTLLYQLTFGLPVGLGLAASIGFIYYTGLVWYKRAGMLDNQSSPWILMVALAIIAVFMAVVGKRFQWEQLEQKYIELKMRKEREMDNGIMDN